MWFVAKILAVLALVAGAVWVWIGPDWRQLLLNLPTKNDVLFWTQDQRAAGFRMADRLTLLVSSRKVPAGGNVRALPAGPALPLDLDVDAFMTDQNTAAIVVLVDGQLRMERYGLGFRADGRWTSFSVAKSFTSTLVGAAIKDGHIGSVQDQVTEYLPALKGSAYDGVTVEQVLTMTSGVDWKEDYADPTSDVATFLNTPADPGEAGIVTHLKRLPRAHPPGTVYNYSTGETNLIGLVVSEAIGEPLANYLSRKVWQPYGMEQQATWLLGGTGEELSGCCLQMATRDLARFGQFILEGGHGVLPDGWIETATSRLQDSGIAGRGYGYQWWTLPGDDTVLGVGIFGQGLMIDFERKTVVAINSNWTTARGMDTGEYDAKIGFYRAVQRAVNAER